MMQRNAIALGAALTLVMGLFCSGCIEDDRSFFIRQNQVPQSGCTLTNTTTTYRPRGTLDVWARQGYWLYPLMENNLRSTRTTDGEPDRNVLHLLGYDVDIDLGDIPYSGREDLLSFRYLSTGNIDPGSKLTGEVKVIPDELVRSSLKNIPPGVTVMITVAVRAVAKRSSMDQDSSTFIYPIDLCNGCLIDQRTTCPTSTTTGIKVNYCGTPQDIPVTCCMSTSNVPVCYASSST